MQASDEEIFRRSLSQTKATLMSAGTDSKKLLTAFLGLSFRCRGRVVEKYEFVALKRNRVYLGASPNYPKTRMAMWIFDSGGAVLGELVVPTKRLATGLQVADSIRRMKKNE